MDLKSWKTPPLREYHGDKPLIPPWVIERIVLGPPPKPKRPTLLRWLKR
jgi:hypothetical protein